MNMRKEYEELRKAIDSTSTNGNNVLQPQVLTDVITNYVQIVPTVRNYIARVDFPTGIYQWNSRTAPVQAASAADGATIPFTNPAYLRGSAQMSQIYAAFQVTNFAKMGAAPLIDIVTDEVQQAMWALLRKEDQFIIQGDSNNSQFPGLLSAATTTAPTSAVGGSGKTLSRLLFDNIETYQNSKGYQVDAWFVSPNVYSLLKNVAFNSVRFTNITENTEAIVGYSQSPISTIMLNGKPVVMDIYMNNGVDNVLAVSLDKANLVTASLQDPTVEDFTNVNPQFDGQSYRLKEYCVTVLKNPNSAVLLSNVTIPAPASF